MIVAARPLAGGAAAGLVGREGSEMIIGCPARELAPFERLELAAGEFQRVLFRTTPVLTALVLAPLASTPLACATVVPVCADSCFTGLLFQQLLLRRAARECPLLRGSFFQGWVFLGGLDRRGAGRDAENRAAEDRPGQAGDQTDGTFCKPPTSPHADQCIADRIVPVCARAPARTGAGGSGGEVLSSFSVSTAR